MKRGSDRNSVFLEHWHEVALEEHAGRLAAGVPYDLDAGWRRRITCDLASGERARVRHRRERAVTPPAPDGADVHGIVGGDPVEIVAVREAAVDELVGPAHVVVRRATHRHEDDPLIGLRRLSGATGGLDDLHDRSKSGDGDAAARLQALAIDVRVGVEEPRQHGAAGEIDAPRGGPGLARERRRRADGGDAATAHRHRLGDA